MDRRNFLNELGAGAAFVLTAVCLGGCVKKEFPPTPDHIKNGNFKLPGDEKVDITIDITDAKYANLKWDGGWVIVNSTIVVAKTENTGDYVAASRICSDEVLPGIIYSGGEWYCTEHDATYDINGQGTQTFNNKGFKGLRVYKTSLNQNQLHIFSV